MDREEFIKRMEKIQGNDVTDTECKDALPGNRWFSRHTEQEAKDVARAYERGHADGIDSVRLAGAEYPNLNQHSTGIDQKRDNFPAFVELIKNQFWHGGEKYRLTEDKEFTDHICEFVPGVTGVDWVLGTVYKYLGRYKNFGREKDLLKIATYMYILWLKGGFHLKDAHDEDTQQDGRRTDLGLDNS